MQDTVQGTLGAFGHMVWVGKLEAQGEVDPSLRAGLIIGSWPPERAVLLETATHSGRVRVKMALHDREPPLPATEWEDISIASLLLNEPVISVVPMGGDGDVLSITLPRPGMYAVRAAGKNRVPDEYEETGEEYLIDLWPEADARTPHILKLTSPYSRS